MTVKHKLATLRKTAIDTAAMVLPSPDNLYGSTDTRGLQPDEVIVTVPQVTGGRTVNTEVYYSPASRVARPISK